jgi:hypothetical protein
MAEPRTLRTFPPLMPPSRPKKAPSPRLTPRRSSRRSPGRRFSLSEGQENNAQHESSGCGIASGVQKVCSVSTRSNAMFSIQTSPMRNSASLSAARKKAEQKQDFGRNPHSPIPRAVSNAAKDISSPGSATKAKSDLSVFDFVDEDSVPLTPRNLVMDPSAEAQFIALTPPATSPTPLVVSAKRFGKNVKRTYSTKRRRPSDDDYSSGSDDDDDQMRLPEGLSPNQRAQEYWKRCYGSKKPQDLLVNPQWSAKRAAPTKSW